MLNSIIAFAIRNKLIILLFVTALVGYGAFEVTKLPIDAVPDITDNQVQIITITPSLGAPDVERLITFPIEQVNSNIPGLKKIRSFSRFGLSVVTVVFDDNVDVYWARQQVTERLLEAQEKIPKSFGTPKLAPVTTGLGEIYQYAVRARKGFEGKYPPTELRTIQDWIIRRQLLNVKGVADVSSFGGYLKQYEIAVDPAKLKANDLTINDIFTALENNNQNTGGAYIEKGPTLLFIRTEGLVRNFDDIKNIVVKNIQSGSPLLIRDVADVRFGYATRYGAMTYNGEGEVSGAVVMMLKGANSNEVISSIKRRVEEIQKQLPEGVVIDAFLDRSKMVNNAIHTVTRNLIEGALIVVLVLVFFLGNLRAGLIVASVIPLSMLFAVILMNMFGVSGNLMSLGALDFGLIVDGAVIIVEAIMHQLYVRNQGAISQAEMDSEVVDVSARMRNAAVFGEVIILIVYIPIFTLEGIEGKMFRPMAQTVAFALLGAFILSLTYIPVMSALFLNKNPSHTGNIASRIMDWLTKGYHHALEKILVFPKTLVASTVILFGVSVFILTRIGGEFIPSLEEGDFAVETRVLTGSNLTTSMTAVSQASKILLAKFPEVVKVVGKTGSSEIPTDPMPIDASDMMVILKDKSQWTSATTFDELTEKMSKALEAVPGVTFGFQFPVQMRFNELMTGARQDVVCKIYGEDLDTLAMYAERLGHIVNGVEGTSDLYVEAVTGMPQIVVQYNRKAIAQYGLNISDINKVVNAAFAGETSGLVYEGEKRFDLVVRLSGEQRKNFDDVRNLLIPTGTNSQIPLYQVADVSMTEGPNQIQREDAQRRIIVGFNVRGRDVQSLVQELQQKTNAQIKLAPGYHVTYGGAFENLEAATKRLSIAVPVSLLLIFLMLYFAFHSVRQGLLIYSAIPLSATGGILALAIRGMPFSISAGVGFIALFGVAVLNGIVLIAEFNRLKHDGMTDLKEIVFKGTSVRLRPVLMTAFVASLGFLPMALSSGSGAEVQRPLATVVIGGLLIATFLTLFVLPSLYIMFEKGVSIKKTTVASFVLFFVTLFGISNNVSGQKKILSIDEAVETAIKNNLSLKNEKLNALYLEKLKSSGWDIPQTLVAGEYGQINSRYKDNRLVISQAIRFPTVYSRQRSLLNEEWKSGELTVQVKENDLKKRVTETYMELLYLNRKLSLLRHIDSLYTDFLKVAELRFSTGESNLLEKTSAQTQQGQINQQLLMLGQDYDVVQLQLQVLLNTTDKISPDVRLSRLPAPAMDSSGVSRHPYIRLLQQNRIVADARFKAERAKYLPDLTAGYYNMSMRGFGADEKSYGYGSRFQAFQVGIGIPIFHSSLRARTGALRINQQITDNNLRSGLQNYNSQYQQAMRQFTRSANAVQYYETNALPNSGVISTTATQQFKNGDINYLQWVLLINQSVAIQSEYVDAIKSLNQSIIDLNYLLNQ